LTPAPGDAAWLRYATLVVLGARVRQPPTGKFNAGQKLNTWYWLLAWGGLSATGLVLAVNFFTKSVFEAAFVEEVFPLHELLAFVSILPLAGHLYVALANRGTRPALRGIITGDVDAAWAREHHAAWYDRRMKDEG
jgi:formate dehydrogenase subunit gamma